jgi:uncharacterized protein
MPSRSRGILDRREFLKRGALAGLGLGLAPFASRAMADTPPATVEVRGYHELGKTGFKISDISFGSARLEPGGEDIVLHALDRGINYFDTADSYTGGDAETTIGNALKGKRDKVYIASKVLAAADDSKETMMQHLEGSLQRLKTDRIDVYFMHAVNNLERLKNPEWYEFTSRARQQGKILKTGMSGHAGHLIECLDYAIDSGQFNVILCAYNFGQDPHFYQRFFRSFDFVALQPDLPRVIKKAKDHGMGVIAMKTLMGARLNDLRPYETRGATFSQAAFRWVLSNHDVDALVVTMTSADIIDEYLGASGARATASADIPLLKRYAHMNGASYCRHGCDACESACPYGVAIPDVMRTRMYAVDYGDMRLARDEYAMLGAGSAVACLSCDAKPCAGACPHGLKIDEFAPATHRMLAAERA